MAYLDSMDPETGFIDADGVREKGKELTARYNAADPFPSITIDNFLPEALADKFLRHFGPRQESDLTKSFDRDQERFKSSYHPDTLDPTARGIFYAFNSRPFIGIMENITGLKGLIPDPYFLGAGFHEIKNGGHLSIHADFNHHKIMNLERRINVLIYLNKDWRPDYGGQLELWNTEMTRQAASIVPLFNRCVIFNTSSTSMHGNPQPVAHPDDVSRKSIALYYYTATWSDLRKPHTTQFQVRPGTGDRTDWAIKLQELRADLLPPIANRGFAKLGRLVRR